MKNDDFNDKVIATLAEHTAKLDEIFARLKSIDRTLTHSMNRVNSLETGFAFLGCHSPSLHITSMTYLLVRRS